MYARVTSYEGKVEDFAWARAVFEAQVEEKVRRLGGCSGVLLMVDRASGHSLSITLWDNEEAMVKSREDATKIRDAAASFSGATVTDVDEYQVVLAEMDRPDANIYELDRSR